jgi:GT2 family glycosyltransferase
MTSALAVINWNSGRLLRVCIESLLEAVTTAEIVVVDNASEDGSMHSVEAFRERVHFVRNGVNRGFAAAVNQAFQATASAYVLVLNPDIRAKPGSIQLLETFMNAHPRCAAIGGYVGERYLPRALPTMASLVRENLWGTRGTRGQTPRPHLQHSKVDEGSDPLSPIKVGQPAAAALMIRRDAYEEVGGFDEQFYPAWYEDVDFCERLTAKGWDIYFAPQAEFIHEGGYSAETMGAERFLRSYYGNQIRYAKKHFSAVGAAAVRASVAAGMIERMIARPRQAVAYGRVLVGALKGS